eukprot:g44375.t1
MVQVLTFAPTKGNTLSTSPLSGPLPNLSSQNFDKMELMVCSVTVARLGEKYSGFDKNQQLSNLLNPLTWCREQQDGDSAGWEDCPGANLFSSNSFESVSQKLSELSGDGPSKGLVRSTRGSIGEQLAMKAAGPSEFIDSDSEKLDLECSICCHDYNWTDKYSTELTASGSLGLPRQEEILSKLSLQLGVHSSSSATLSQQLILTLDSGETTVIMLPTVSLSVEQGDGQRASRSWNLRDHSLVRQNQKQQAVVCLRKASWRVATLLI